MTEKTFDLKNFSEEKLNIIIEGLAELPAKRSMMIITEIHEQVNAQLSPVVIEEQ